MKIGTWLKGLGLLRHPDVVKYLGEQRVRLGQLREIRRLFPSARLHDSLQLCGYEEGRLDLGAGSSVCHGTVLSFGDQLNGFGRIAIGDRTWVGEYNNLRACEGGFVSIGADCLISQFCSLVASNHDLKRGAPIKDQAPDPRRLGVTIKDDVWLGAGVVLLPGVTVSTGAVIGANSVVTKSVGAYEIWAGCPAARIGARAD